MEIEDVDIALNDLRLLAFPTRDLKIYQNKLSKIRKIKFPSYMAYYKELINLKNKVNACLKDEDHLADESLFQHFQYELPKEDQRELLRAKCSTIKEALSLFETFEQIETVFQNKKFKSNEYTKKPYCKMHKTSSYNNEQCYAQNKSNKKGFNYQTRYYKN